MTRYMLSASLIALASAATAQVEFDLGTISVATNQVPLDIERIGSEVEVLDEEALQNAPNSGVANRLARLPGVSVTSNGGAGQLGQLRIRGQQQRYAPVLLNGVEILDASQPYAEFNWANILIGGLSRAEIVKGSQSARNGSNAVAGFVALETVSAPQASGREGRVNLEVGSYGTASATLSYGVAGERAGLAFSASRLKTGGFNIIEASGFDEADGFDATQYSLDAYVDITNSVRLGMTGFHFDGTSEYDNVFSASPEDATTNATSRGARIYVETTTGALKHEFSASRYLIDRRNNEAGTVTNFGATRDVLSHKTIWEFGQGSVLSLGNDLKFEEASAGGTSSNIENRGYFAEFIWAVSPETDVTVSLRRETHSEFGSLDSARLAAVWRATSNLTLRGSAAKGFRVPSLDELFNPAYGNATLAPEHSTSFELGASYIFANGTEISGTIFRTLVDDLITFGTKNYVQDSDRSTTQGVELAAFVPVTDRVSLFGNFTFSDARDINGAPEQKVPRYDLTFELDARVTDQLSLGVSATHKADWAPTYDPFFATREVDDFTVVDARASYMFDNGMEAYLRIENLFDADYQTVPGYEQPGRSVFFGINASF